MTANHILYIHYPIYFHKLVTDEMNNDYYIYSA